MSLLHWIMQSRIFTYIITSLLLLQVEIRDAMRVRRPRLEHTFPLQQELLTKMIDSGTLHLELEEVIMGPVSTF